MEDESGRIVRNERNTGSNDNNDSEQALAVGDLVKYRRGSVLYTITAINNHSQICDLKMRDGRTFIAGLWNLVRANQSELAEVPPTKFRVGDKVRCIRTAGTLLLYKAHYEITGLSNVTSEADTRCKVCSNKHMDRVHILEDEQAFCPSRFELSTQQIKTPEPLKATPEVKRTKCNLCGKTHDANQDNLIVGGAVFVFPFAETLEKTKEATYLCGVCGKQIADYLLYLRSKDEWHNNDYD